MDVYPISLRECCKILGLRRASFYDKPKRVNEDSAIASALHAEVKKQGAWGFMMIYHRLRNAGHKWGKSRVYRVYKAENLHLRKKPKRTKIKRAALNMLAASQINQGWSMDFLSEAILSNNNSVRVLNVLDECSRKVLISLARPVFKAKNLVEVLTELILQYGKPQYFRCDNGPEYISQKLVDFAAKMNIEIKHSQPGRPTQNGLVERLNGTLRTECLNQQYFSQIEDVQHALDLWWNCYNFDRPHSSLGYKTPQQFVDLNPTLQFKVDAA
jgi:putative transposase